MKIQERLYEAFISRPFGRLSGEVILGNLGLLLHRPLREARDLLTLSDTDAHTALQKLPDLDIHVDPSDALGLIAASS